jgi:hypothetical protein
MPKNHSLPFLDWYISESRSRSRFLVDGGAAIKVAPTMVLLRMAVDFVDDTLVQFMLIEQPPELQRRGRSGADSWGKSMQTKPRMAWLS